MSVGFGLSVTVDKYFPPVLMLYRLNNASKITVEPHWLQVFVFFCNRVHCRTEACYFDLCVERKWKCLLIRNYIFHGAFSCLTWQRVQCHLALINTYLCPDVCSCCSLNFVFITINTTFLFITTVYNHKHKDHRKHLSHLCMFNIPCCFNKM